MSNIVQSFLLPVRNVDPTVLFGESEFTYVDISAVDRVQRKIVNPQVLTPDVAPSRARQVLAAGDVIVSTVRPNLNTVALVPDFLDGAIASTGFCVLRPDHERLDKRFLFYWISSGPTVQRLVEQATGATYPAVSDKVIRSLLFSPPELTEQKRIATILDKVDSLRDKRQDGMLLADEFLRSVFIDFFGVPGVSSKWPESSVANMVSRIESGWSAPSSDRDLNNQDLAVLRVSAVSTGWFLPDEAKPIDREIVNRPLVFPRRGDLLFSRANTRELVAACCLVDEDIDNRFLPDKLWRVTADPKQATNEYLCYLFRHPAFRHELTKQATGTSGSMLNISQAKLLCTPAPIPPISLQERFTKIVNRVHAVRKNSLQSLNDLQYLKESLAAKFFY
jgi:type I restriction enzyme S subunit